jgi:hypothetical protein
MQRRAHALVAGHPPVAAGNVFGKVSMNEVEPEPSEESYISLLAAGEQALAAGITLSIADAEELPPEVQGDLKRDLACVELLRQVLPRYGQTGRAQRRRLGVDRLRSFPGPTWADFRFAASWVGAILASSISPMTRV